MGASTILPGGGTAQQSKDISTAFGHGEAPGTGGFFYVFLYFAHSPLAESLVGFYLQSPARLGEYLVIFLVVNAKMLLLAASPETLGPPRRPGRGGSPVPPSRREGKARISG